MVKGEVLSKNLKALNLFLKLGVLSTTVKNDLNIYNYYCLLKESNGVYQSDNCKMNNYSTVAETFNVSESKVRKVVKAMSEDI